MNQPLVSVVTPFYNTVQYLAECIESVLGQSYEHFEYILVDNCSTDGSREIAEMYAKRDRRIRLIRRPALLSQVQNYNSALKEVGDESKYCKIVQADDYILRDCLRKMVQMFETSESIGLVSAYDLKGDVVRGSGFPFRKEPWPGRKVAQMHLRSGVFVFGSPTTVMYRSSLVREGTPFYKEGLLHEDTEKCFQILEKWDFGFVYEVLSFLRADNESISSAVRRFQPNLLDRYIVVQHYASVFLEQSEAAALRKAAKRDYYQSLAHAALRFREREFWHYHEKGLKTIGEKIDWIYVTFLAGRDVLWMALNPGSTVSRIVRHSKNGHVKEGTACE